MPQQPFDRSRTLAAALLVCLLGTPSLAQIGPATALLEQSAWKALDAGQHESAATAFREAIAIDPKNPRLHVGAAVAAYALRRDAEAQAAVDRALALDPARRDARELQGRLLYRGGDLNGAILVFDALSGDGAPGRSVTATLERWRREADLRDRMTVAVGAGVTVAFEGPEDAELAQQALGSTERASARLWEVLSCCLTAPVAVVLYTNEQFRDITRLPPWAGGAFDGTIRVPMGGVRGRSAELDRVLAHELTHALVHSLAPGGVPAWLNEGLAAALEIAERPPAPHPSVALPLGALREPFHRMSGEDARQAYAFSAFAVQRLLDEAGGFAIMEMLLDIGHGADFETAFAYHMQRSLADFEVSLNRQQADEGALGSA